MDPAIYAELPIGGTMDGLIAINELNEMSKQLSAAVTTMGRYGRELAEANQAYKVALAQAALELRAEGMPVTLIDKVAPGKAAKQAFKRDTAEVMYDTAKEHVNALKLQIRVLDAQIAREWGSNG